MLSAPLPASLGTSSDCASHCIPTHFSVTALPTDICLRHSGRLAIQVLSYARTLARVHMYPAVCIEDWHACATPGGSALHLQNVLDRTMSLCIFCFHLSLEIATLTKVCSASFLFARRFDASQACLSAKLKSALGHTMHPLEAAPARVVSVRDKLYIVRSALRVPPAAILSLIDCLLAFSSDPFESRWSTASVKIPFAN